MKISAGVAVAVFAVLALSSHVEAQRGCFPGQQRMQACNTCFCTPTGVWACTRRGCIGKREARCTPGTTFKNQCNTCRCSADGQQAFCSRKACPPGSA
ncbi:serine protease inhibitor I/II-like [Schistocerca nitens]|uniref:serine protease inhibitor I/II-like n=1 Tax=Schistocerca nitens TaxID=7011 RepID=UPI00211750B9|nr:serine protease inhibitor I/II-like [Schistocerca nitens]XP_049793734.1 serine protease inhibitor I/II-like [Schistocerca nitens]